MFARTPFLRLHITPGRSSINYEGICKADPTDGQQAALPRYSDVINLGHILPATHTSLVQAASVKLTDRDCCLSEGADVF